MVVVVVVVDVFVGKRVEGVSNPAAVAAAVCPSFFQRAIAAMGTQDVPSLTQA